MQQQHLRVNIPNVYDVLFFKNNKGRELNERQKRRYQGRATFVSLHLPLWLFLLVLLMLRLFFADIVAMWLVISKHESTTNIVLSCDFHQWNEIQLINRPYFWLPMFKDMWNYSLRLIPCLMVLPSKLKSRNDNSVIIKYQCICEIDLS